MARTLGRTATGTVALITAGALALAACSGTGSGNDPTGGDRDDSTQGSGETGEVTFAYLGDAANLDVWESLFAEFNKVHPGITVKPQGIPASNWAEFANAVAARLAGGEQIDIVQIATEGQRLFASKGVLEPLQPYFDQDPELVDDYFEDINPRLRGFNDEFMADPDGNVVFVPGGFNTMVMYLNTDVFAAAGVPIPEDGNWTWEEFKQDAVKIKEKTGAYMAPFTQSYFGTVMPFVTTNGSSVFNDDWSEATFDTPEVAEAAAYVRELIELGVVPEPGGEIDVYSQFAQGNLAIVTGGRWPTINVRDIDMVDKTVIVNWPTNVTNGTPVGWDAWNITKVSPNKDAAWTLIKFLMSKEAGEYFASIGGTIVPARESVANSAAFTDNAPEGSERLSNAMSFATPIPSPDKGAEIQQAIEDAWLTILTGNAQIDDVLASTQQELQNLVDN